tara:strand:+ start:328 stop:528 length:201 start_codon:yes stop_codon:yes gene_type:complete
MRVEILVYNCDLCNKEKSSHITTKAPYNSHPKGWGVVAVPNIGSGSAKPEPFVRHVCDDCIGVLAP